MASSKRRITSILAAAAVSVLNGCAGIVSPPTNFVSYDLDLPAATMRSTGSALVPASIEVRSPSWLASTAMQYRLDYRQPASREAYAESRWAGHPSEMLQRQLVAKFGGRGSGNGQCRLRIDLDEFIQRFDTIETSASELVVTASLLAPREETVLARQRFVIRIPAITADAAGGVLAHRQGAGSLADALGDWLNLLDDGHAQGLNVHQRCGH